MGIFDLLDDQTIHNTAQSASAQLEDKYRGPTRKYAWFRGGHYRALLA
jgi:hypothetical protein